MDKAIEPFFAGIESKEVEGGRMYKVSKKFIKMPPLGYFPTREEAIESFYNYLVNNNLIEAIENVNTETEETSPGDSEGPESDQTTQ